MSLIAADDHLESGSLLFGPFELRLDRRSLLRDGQPVRLGSRAVDLLILLAERSGEVVGNAEILAALWPGMHVGEANIRVHVAALRRALGDRRDALRYVANVPGRGYRFMAPVRRGGRSAAPVASRPPPTLPPPTSPPATLPGVTLPRLRRGLVGRDDMLSVLVDLLPHRRLLTLVGPGGVGKTSVALAAARRLEPAYPDGVRFVDLAACDPHAPVAAVASAIGDIDATGPGSRAVADALGDRRMLLVLDNCERVIEPVAALAEALLADAGGIDILATSREPLHAEGEWLRRLPGLPVPPVDGLRAAEAESYPAVALFVERLRAAAGDFAFEDGDVPAIVRICRRLDGMPLALELAAANGALLGIGGLVAHLDRQLDLLVRGRRTAPPRHRTLRAMLDWSYDLLPLLERRVLARLSVLGAPFDLGTAIAVGGADDADEAAIAEAIFRLVDKSLIAVEPSGNGTRFRLLETTRIYAAEKPEAAGPARAGMR